MPISQTRPATAAQPNTFDAVLKAPFPAKVAACSETPKEATARVDSKLNCSLPGRGYLPTGRFNCVEPIELKRGSLPQAAPHWSPDPPL